MQSGNREIVALRKLEEEIGISRTTLWRFRQRGWLKTIVIAGRPYVLEADLNDFLKRASIGEFRKAQDKIQ